MVDQPGGVAVKGAERARRSMMRVVVAFRSITMVHVAVSALLPEASVRPSPAALVLAAAAFLQGAVVVRTYLTARREPVALAVWDSLFAAGALIAGAAISRQGGYDPWDFLYPYTTITLVVVSATVRGGLAALAAGSPVIVAYVGSSLLLRQGMGDRLPIDLTTDIGFAVAMWVVAREIRRWAQALDVAAREAVARQAELSAEQERNRYVRELHDHVLQTLETLARGRFVSDERMRGQVARQAFRLRRLVEGGWSAPDVTGSLGAALAAVAEEHIEQGLTVDLQSRRLRHEIPDAVAAALTAAVGEALTNVRKHSGAGRAVVQVVSGPGEVTVSVLDRGTGFDPESVGSGLGLRESIGGRMTAVGGSARIDSADGAGTCVVLVVPLEEPVVAPGAATGDWETVG